ncbi:MAG: peptidylprolyl isomerase [Planctomycetota bacterium]
MDLRLVAVSLLLLATTAIAQAQDPDKPQPQPVDVIRDLTAEKERLLREIAYAKDRAKNGKALLAGRFVPATQGIRAIDAGRSVTFTPMAPVQPPQPRAARVGTAEEMTNHPDDTMLVVNGRAIPTSAYDSLMKYLAEHPGATDEKMRSQRALYELIRIEAIAASFEDNEAAEKAGDVMGQLEAGKTVGDLAKTVGVVPGCDAEGKFEATRSSVFGPRFEQVAFATEAGKRSRPFRNGNGLVILQVEKFDKGATADLDKVVGTALQIPYSNDPDVLQKAQMAVTTVQIDVVARDQKTLEMLPELFRTPAPSLQSVSPVPQVDKAALTAQMEALRAEITKLQGQTDDASKQRLQALEGEYTRLKNMLRATETDAEAPKVPAPVKKAPEPAKQN